MNKKIIIVSILALFCWRISAQENNSQPSDFRRHEIGISFGAFSQPSIFYAGSEVLPVFYEGFKGENNKICRYNIGTFSLSYWYHFTERHSLGVVSTLLFSKIVDKYYVNDHSGVFTFWSLEPQYRLTYKRFKHCALYFGAAVGVTFRIASNDKLPILDTADGGWFSIDYGRFFVLPSSHVTFLGVSVGRDNAANFELGFGTQGILNVGYSLKF